PASAHTYDNNIFLPIVDRFLTLGGAADSNGGHYLRANAEGTGSRRTGPYLFDPARAHPNRVGGSTGSHVRRVAPSPDGLGGNMWQNRDNFLNASPLPSDSFVNGCTGYAEEGGKDVVYVRVIRNGVYKYTIHDLRDPRRDTWEHVGRYWDGPGSKTTCAYD